MTELAYHITFLAIIKLKIMIGFAVGCNTYLQFRDHHDYGASLPGGRVAYHTQLNLVITVVIDLVCPAGILYNFT